MFRKSTFRRAAWVFPAAKGIFRTSLPGALCDIIDQLFVNGALAVARAMGCLTAVEQAVHFAHDALYAALRPQDRQKIVLVQLCDKIHKGLIDVGRLRDERDDETVPKIPDAADGVRMHGSLKFPPTYTDNAGDQRCRR